MKPQRYIFHCLLLLVIVAATNASWKAPALDLPAEVGPYQLDYPAYFGDQLALYPSNPITKEGVFLGGCCFMRRSCPATTPCRAAGATSKKSVFGRPSR